MKNSFNKHITCAFLYSITRYGYPPNAENMISYINEMADLGFQSIELEGIGETGLKTVYKHRKEIKQVLEDLNVVLPIFCTVLPGLSSPDNKIAQKNLDLFKIGCELGAYFGARGVLDNGPLIPFDFPKDMSIHRHYSPEVLNNVGLPQDLIWKSYWTNLLSTMEKLCNVSADWGLNYYMHPCVGSLTDTTNGFLLIKDSLRRKNLKFCFDTSNLFFMRENLSLSLLKLEKDLDYIHVSDSYGQAIEHQAIGSGSIDWNLFFQTLKQIGFSGELSIDVGGDESHIENIDDAYLKTAKYIEEKVAAYEVF